MSSPVTPLASNTRAVSATRGNSNTCHRGPVFQSIHFHREVILQEEEADDGEQVDQDERQNCSQNNGAAIPCDTFDDIE